MVNHIDRLINILLVEDNPGDAFIINNTLAQTAVSYKLDIVLNGEQAMDFLNQERDYTNVSRPDLILLDLNLPLKNGFEVLEEIKSSPKLKMIPTIILTSSSSEKDILKSYNLFASCYLTKPADFNDFTNEIKSLEHFWLNLVQLPPQLQN